MAQKKYASLSTLSTFLDNLKNLFVTKSDLNTSLSSKADTSHKHSISDTTNLQSTLDSKVPTSRTINNKPLSGNITLSASDIGAASSTHDHNSVYYTQSQVDTKLSGKSDKTHNHDSDYADIDHNHDGVYAVEGHNHDNKYDAKGTASSTVSTHNTSTSAHNDIRGLITDLTTKLNNFLDVDETTSDQLSEVLQLIEDNKGTLESLTTSKINVSDIVNNLTTNSTSKVLSAAQGVAIQKLINDLQAELDSHSHTVSDISDLTVTATELNHMDGVTSNVQLQLDEMEDSLSDKLSSEDFARNITSSANTVGQYGKVAYGSGKFVAIPYTYADDISKFAYSSDGEVWAFISAPVETDWNDIIYANGKFVAIGKTSSTQIYSAVSTDGINWTVGNLPTGGTPYSIAYGNGRFVMVGSNTVSAYSTDGLNWTKVLLPSTCQAMKVVFGNGVFVAPNPNGYVCAYSTDGSSWTMGDIIAGEFSRIVFNNGRFVAVGNNSIQYSDDGVNWVSVTPPMTANWYALAFGEGYYIALGYNKSTYIYSADGITWQTATAPVSDYWCDVEYGGGKFIAVTEGGQNFLTISFTKNEFGLAYESDIENLKNSFPDVYTKTDSKWNLLYDSGEISAIANSISNIDVSGYNHIQVLVRIYNDGDSINSRAGSAIFTCENGKTYQFPVWSNMFSKSINTVYTMATFNLVDGWLICPCASRLIGDASTFEDTEGGTAGNLSLTGSGMMKCTSPLSTLTVSSLDQNSNYYFGMGSRVMVWGWNA